MCDKAVDHYSIALEFAPHQYRTHEICARVISDDLF